MFSPKILVIEDEEIFALDLRKKLQELGYTVSEITNSGEEAIKTIAETHPNLVLIGTRWAETTDGVHFADTITNTFQVPVLHLTKYSERIKVQKNRRNKPWNSIVKKLAERELHIAIEIALRKHYAERTLKAEQQKFTAILRSMGCAVIITDNYGHIQMMNPLAEVLTACAQHEAMNKKLANILRAADKEIREGIENLTIQVLQEGVSLNLPKNCILYAKDSREIHIEGSITPIRDDNGHIKGSVLVFQDITQRKQVEADLIRNAFYDTLTGLPNRALFLERLGQAFERSQRINGYQFAVLFLDLDGFKAVNDNYGHLTGDRLLIETARRLESCLRSGDTVGRFGGDEFVVLVEDIKEIADAINVAHRIQNSLKLPVAINAQQLYIGVSIGIAINCCAYKEPSSLLRDADIAMYRAKAQGKAQYAVFNFPQLLVAND